MPIITVQLTQQLSSAQHQNLADAITAIMHETLGKKPHLTAVTFTYTPTTNWFINSKAIDNQLKNSAFVVANISANTNSDADKAKAIDQIYESLKRFTGELDEISYVIINEIPTTDWGYGGKTQHERSLKRTASGAIDTEHYLAKGRISRSKHLFSFLNRLIRQTRKA